uniref:Uncharacterized protein LOC101503597 n=1 Tax=Cicer arietinum TaxID=3827 RepID=A0A1S2XQR6_CICAR|nr:uncharacterized protein LOC101503597 [Cicer arietinum]
MAPTTTTITMIKLLAFVYVIIVLLENSHVVSSTTIEPTISASPGVLPYVTNSPDISSFFPAPMISSEGPSEAEAPAPAPSSGEFSSTSTSFDFNCVAAIFGIMLSSVFLSIA